MALKKMLQRFTATVSELDRENLRTFCLAVPGAVPIGDAHPRDEVKVVGEISSVRIVPRVDGSPWLEATLTDGTGSLVAMWTGRKRIAGIRPGQRLVLIGRGSPTGPGGRLVIYNPRYELLG
ncbi:MAG TPA: OB-fold nucleic acid binding domain-containing protein [Acidimicrobiales bacterium]|nr:OB-fold nucleic acid binding domain-containing protein [Acidimicrobiales bacterium]